MVEYQADTSASIPISVTPHNVGPWSATPTALVRTIRNKSLQSCSQCCFKGYLVDVSLFMKSLATQD